SSRKRTRTGGGGTDLRDIRGLARSDSARALLGGVAGAGHQICAPHRRIGGLPGCAPLNQPRARGYHSHAEPSVALRGREPVLEEVETRWPTIPPLSRAQSPVLRRTRAKTAVRFTRARGQPCLHNCAASRPLSTNPTLRVNGLRLKNQFAR